MFLNFCTKYACACAFFGHIFPGHFVCFSVFIAIFFYFLCSFSEMKAKTVCARAQATFLQSSGHSVKEVAKLLKKTQQGLTRYTYEARTFYSPPLRKRQQKIKEAILVINMSAGYSM